MPNRLSAPAFIFIKATVSAIIEISADRFRNAPVAQLDRASGYEPEGREFESLRARHFFRSGNKQFRDLSSFRRSAVFCTIIAQSGAGASDPVGLSDIIR